jgi:hypothetical protein
VLAALRETGELVGAALGDQRRRELRTQGAAVSMDEAISYLLANIDPKLLTGPSSLVEPDLAVTGLVGGCAVACRPLHLGCLSQSVP